MIRKPTILLLALMMAALALPALGHPADEVRQVSLQVQIDDQAVVQQVRLPLGYALEAVYNGLPLAGYRQLEPRTAELILAQAMGERNPVVIDGVTVLPVIRDLRIEGFTPAVPVATQSDAALLQSGALAFEADYTTLGRPPATVSVTWRMIAPERPAAVLGSTGETASNAGIVAASIGGSRRGQLALFTEKEPEHIWHSKVQAGPVSLRIPPQNKLPGYHLPVLAMAVVFIAGVATFFVPSVRGSLLVLGIGVALSLVLAFTHVGSIHIERQPPPPTVPPAEQAQEIFTVLHRNIYRAFDYTHESAIYDALAQSVDGPELAVIYNDVYQSLILRDQGGAVCKVQDVRVQEAQVLDEPVAGEPGGYKVRCVWEVDGLVQHHGHTHARTNRLAAVYTLAPRYGQWRIIGTDIIEQQRTDDGNQTLEDLFDLENQAEAGDAD